MRVRSYVLHLGAIAALALAISGPVSAQTAGSRHDGMTPTYPGMDSDAFQEFGGKVGVDMWVDDLFKHILDDSRIAQIFTSHGKVKDQIALNKQLEIMLLGGAKDYTGPSLAAAHESLGLTLTDFNAVVEDAYLACDDARISYHACNQLIAALAPYEHDIVTK